jgi:hypothetical protein
VCVYIEEAQQATGGYGPGYPEEEHEDIAAKRRPEKGKQIKR